MTELKEVKDNVEDGDKILKAILAADTPEPDDWKELQQILSMPVTRRALKLLLVMSDNGLKVVGMADISTEKGRMDAILMQGKARGLSDAVSTLIDLITSKGENHG